MNDPGRRSGPNDPLAAARAALEAGATDARIIELELSPVRGSFDAAHLREVHRLVFRDLPGLGLPEFRPGEYRDAVPAKADWVKRRQLRSQPSYRSIVVYARMDDFAQRAIEAALAKAKPAGMRDLATTAFAERLGDVYTRLDWQIESAFGTPRR